MYLINTTMDIGTKVAVYNIREFLPTVLID